MSTVTTVGVSLAANVCTLTSRLLQLKIGGKKRVGKLVRRRILPTLERISLCSVAFSRLLLWREISHVTLKGCNLNLVRLRTLRHETFRFSLVSTITHISMFKEFQYTLYIDS